MASERTLEEILELVRAQAHCQWREAQATPPETALRVLATELLLIERQPLPPDLEPRFF